MKLFTINNKTFAINHIVSISKVIPDKIFELNKENNPITWKSNGVYMFSIKFVNDSILCKFINKKEAETIRKNIIKIWGKI